MNATVAIAKALSDRARLRILMFLRPGELCVCQMVELLGLAPSTVSRHLSILQQAGLLVSRKDKRWVYYSLAGRKASPAAQKALKWVGEALSGDELVLSDALALRKMTGMEKERLCRIQAKR